MELIKHIHESIFNTFVDIEIFWGGLYDPEISKFGQIWSFSVIFFIKRVVAKIKQVQNLSYGYGINKTYIWINF